jgi:hypothetical protein
MSILRLSNRVKIFGVVQRQNILQCKCKIANKGKGIYAFSV